MVTRADQLVATVPPLEIQQPMAASRQVTIQQLLARQPLTVGHMVKPIWLHIYLCARKEVRNQFLEQFAGPSSSKLNDIAISTGTELKLRGQGSGRKEGPGEVEAPEPLMVSIRAPIGNGHGFLAAVAKTVDLLKAAGSVDKVSEHLRSQGQWEVAARRYCCGNYSKQAQGLLQALPQVLFFFAVE